MNWILRLVVLSASALMFSQEPSTTPLAFEVASIRPNVSVSGGSSTNSANGSLQITNQTLRRMIEYAYNVRDFQISGGPGWMSSNRYDVKAKPENSARDSQIKQMLQTLLAERFELRIHRVTREGAVYSLLVGKDGTKLQPTKESATSGSTSGRNRETGMSTLKGTRVTATEIAADLAAQLERPVFDKTGLTGKYDFELSWVPDLTPGAASGPSLFTAVQEQLGLRLESDRGPIEVLVIDNAALPKEN
jgi:uncharacterized protein (TIGR03435 family)